MRRLQGRQWIVTRLLRDFYMKMNGHDLPKGYAGKILTVDLEKKRYTAVPLERPMTDLFTGCRGLGLALLVKPFTTLEREGKFKPKLWIVLAIILTPVLGQILAALINWILQAMIDTNLGGLITATPAFPIPLPNP